MGRFVFKLPDVGEGTAEAEIVGWHVKAGDVVGEDQPLVDVMTDKATVEITSPVAGKVVDTTGKPGDMAPVGAPLVVFEVDGRGNEAAAPAAKAEPKAASVGRPPPAKPAAEVAADSARRARKPAGAEARACVRAAIRRRRTSPSAPPSPPAWPTSGRWPRRRCAGARASWGSSCSTCRDPAPAAASSTPTSTPS